MNRSIQAELRAIFAAETLSQSRRALRLRLGRTSIVGADLLVQRIDIQEALNNGIAARLTCLSASVNLPLKSFIGQPAEIQIITDQGAIRRICTIVTSAKVGQSDGSLTVYELEAQDALAVLERRINSRVFRRKSDLEIAEIVPEEWRQRSPALASSFDFVCQGMSRERYPPREFVHQLNESDAAFLRRLLRRSGISWFFRPGADDGQVPQHQMVLFDDGYMLKPYSAGPVRFHRDDATESRDAITRVVHARKLVTGAVERLTREYKAARIDQASDPSGVDQGETGNELAAFLLDAQVEMPHAADNGADLARRTRLRMQHHELEAKCLHGESGVRDLCVGEYIHITGHPEIDTHPASEREFIVLELHHRAENNLPKELDARIHLLTGNSEPPLEDDKRYINTFKLVRRDTPVVPQWNPVHDLPKVHPMTAIVVGPESEEIYTDELGRVKIQFQGYKPQDHEHSQGAGTNGNGSDSAWVRFVTALAGNHFGANFIPRIGMEVYVDFEGGDPDRPIVVGIVHNGRNMPAAWSDVGGLPGNRYISGIKTKEIHGSGYSQLRYDDTPGQISAQLANTHGNTQLNKGFLTHPREDGNGAPRGEGAELRSDESVAIRSAKALLISAWKQLNARDRQLARSEQLSLMEDCLSLFKALGQYASEHEGMQLDDKPHAELKDSIKNWEAGSNTEPNGSNGGAPVIAITAPAGISVATPKAIVNYAGSNIDSVAQQHIQYSAALRFNVNAGKGIGLFAHSDGIKLIANQGKFLMQSQHDDIEANAANNITWTAAKGNIVGMAKEITLIAEDGSFIRIGKGITLGTNSVVFLRSSSFTHAGPATEQTNFPTFTKDDLKRELHADYHDGTPVQGAKFTIEYESGATFAGTVDAQGKADLTGAPTGPGRIKLGEDWRAFEVKATEVSPAFKAAWDDGDMEASFNNSAGSKA